MREAPDPDTLRLDEFDRVEWLDICRQLRPDLSAQQFDEMWRAFCDLKKRHYQH